MNDKTGKNLLDHGYWNQFKQRNVHRAVNKRGQKYEIDRDKWTTYPNSPNMCDHVIEEICEAGVTKPCVL